MDAFLYMLQSLNLHASWPLTLFGIKENIQKFHILDSNFLENKIGDILKDF